MFPAEEIYGVGGGEGELGHKESPGFPDGSSELWLPDPCRSLDPHLDTLPPGYLLDFCGIITKHHAAPVTACILQILRESTWPPHMERMVCKYPYFLFPVFTWASGIQFFLHINNIFFKCKNRHHQLTLQVNHKISYINDWLSAILNASLHSPHGMSMPCD